MEFASAVESFALVSVVLVLISASRQDFRTREVSDLHWAVAGAVGICCNLLVSYLTGNLSISVLTSLLAGAVFLPSVLVGSDGTSRILWAVSAVLALSSVLMSDGDGTAVACSVAVLMCFLFLGGYCAGLIRGGADAKCLMVIALAFPVYPDLGLNVIPDVPALLRTVFPPAVAVLFLGSVFSAAGCMVYCTRRNLQNHGFIRGFYRGYMMPAVMVPSSFAWPAENIVDGERVRCGIPADEDVGSICDRFRENGISEMYVTPMVPFVVPLTAALAFVLVFGNPMFIL